MLPVLNQEKDRNVFDGIHDYAVKIMKLLTLHNKREEEVVFLEFEKIGMIGPHRANIE